MNTFGKLITLTTFGESHGAAMGGILDGIPPRLHLDLDELRQEVKRRAPGRDPLTSQRREPDEPEFLSGISPDGVTLGSPIGFIVRNCDARSQDYKGYEGVFRPNHADATYYKKYGIHDFRGGGRASARETVSWVVGGAICRQWLQTFGIQISAKFIETASVAEAKANLTSVGGIVEGLISGLPIGIGEPIFDKIHARMAHAMMTINAAKGFEYGEGFASASMHGNQPYQSGGALGGISDGTNFNFRVYFKPTPTQMTPVEGENIHGEKVIINPKGRHDPCVAIRAVPVVEAMAALTIADLMRIANIR